MILQISFVKVLKLKLKYNNFKLSFMIYDLIGPFFCSTNICKTV